MSRTRSKANVTQEELAKTLGVSTQSIIRWESRNFESTSLANFLKILQYLESKGVEL
ncbi:MAG: helix-turn-helix transcriptional regulator [Iphinoe sp. HA4291-MV1]|nr:helix-turn-helix transcriptional regulator [Iphinoe sp. HA4291-MV1]